MKKDRQVEAVSVKWLLVFAGVTLLLGLTGVLAFYTDQKAVENTISIGSVSVAVLEPEWEKQTQGKPQGIYSGAVLAKDPQITNTGKNACWVRMKLQIPLFDGIVPTQEESLFQEVKDQEMLSWKVDGNWSEAEECAQIVTNTDGTKYKERVFDYQNPLQPGESTTALCQQMKCIEWVEGEIQEGVGLQIPVIAEAIQSEGIDSKEEAMQYFNTQRKRQEGER